MHRKHHVQVCQGVLQIVCLYNSKGNLLTKTLSRNIWVYVRQWARSQNLYIKTEDIFIFFLQIEIDIEPTDKVQETKNNYNIIYKYLHVVVV